MTTHVIDEIVKYDTRSFNHALSSLELLPARYHLKVKVSEVYEVERGRKKEETTFYLHKTNVLVVALKRMWYCFFGGNFDEDSYDISKIMNVISGYFTMNYTAHKPRNYAVMIKNLSHLESSIRNAALSIEDQPIREKLIHTVHLINVQIELLKSTDY